MAFINHTSNYPIEKPPLLQAAIIQTINHRLGKSSKKLSGKLCVILSFNDKGCNAKKLFTVTRTNDLCNIRDNFYQPFQGKNSH